MNLLSMPTKRLTLLLLGGALCGLPAAGAGKQGCRLPEKTLRKADVGKPYEVRLNTSGCRAPYAFSASGLAPGLSLHGGSANSPIVLIGGTPTQPGEFIATVNVTTGAGAAVQRYRIVVERQADQQGGSSRPAAKKRN